MSLKNYFANLISRVETDTSITNEATDEAGFFKPRREVILRNLNLLKDLHDKPLAKKMVQASWANIVRELPPDWLILNELEKAEFKKALE